MSANSSVQISMVANAVATETQTIDAIKLLFDIKLGKWRKEIDPIRRTFDRVFRETGDPEKAKLAIDKLKKRLPGVLWSGVFVNREKPADDKLKTYSGMLGADIDLLGVQLPEVRKKLADSPHVRSIFRSPSGDGLKVVFSVVKSPKRHQDSFRAIAAYVLKLTGREIDGACKNLSRLCFVSHDEDLYLNEQATAIPPLQPLPKKAALFTPDFDLELRQRIVVQRFGSIEWTSPVRGFLSACPGKDLHTTTSTARDCEIYLDGVPTIFCLHNSCRRLLAQINHELRSAIGKAEFVAAETVNQGEEVRSNDSSVATTKIHQGQDDDSSFTSLILPAEFYPAPLGKAALHGLTGDFVERVLPETEADAAALLFEFLISFGNVIGRTAHAVVGPVPHYCNEFAVTVGPTSSARKGDAFWQVRRAYHAVDPEWLANSVPGGLSTGEGLIWAVHDPIIRRVRNRKTREYEEEVLDEGVSDKRLLVVEPEFARVLRCAERDGNTLSAITRAAWDGVEVLRTLTRTTAARATGAHFSLIGNITREELRMLLPTCEYVSGYGNRILWVAVRRWQELPEGGELVGIADLVIRLQHAVEFARDKGEIRRDAAARELWANVYHELSTEKRGLFGAITARAAAHCLRLQTNYALLDCSPVIRAVHVQAALAAWRYCEDSARWIFSSGTGNRVADKILAELKVRGDKGMTRLEIIVDVFNRNVTKATLDDALRLLHHLKAAHCIIEESTGGRRAERWFSFPEMHEQTRTKSDLVRLSSSLLEP
jgi:BT4734-like, N-terminal domain